MLSQVRFDYFRRVNKHTKVRFLTQPLLYFGRSLQGLFTSHVKKDHAVVICFSNVSTIITCDRAG